MTVLDDIVSRTRTRLQQETKPDRRSAEDVAASREAFAFRRALAEGIGPRIIAEIFSLTLTSCEAIASSSSANAV